MLLPVWSQRMSIDHGGTILNYVIQSMSSVVEVQGVVLWNVVEQFHLNDDEDYLTQD